MRRMGEPKMNIISNKLELPLFMLTQNRLKYYRPRILKNYLSRKRRLLIGNCKKEYGTVNAQKLYSRHLLGFDAKPQTIACYKREPEPKRANITLVSSTMPPNLYNVPANILDYSKGAGGAHWAKLPTNKSILQKTTKSTWKFYELPRDTERLTNRYNAHKGKFFSNARDRRATTRFMVMNPTGCYRDPKFPSPATYDCFNHEIGFNLDDDTIPEPDNPHIFLRQSSVPMKKSSLYPKNQSFEPGPGRYETRFPNVCFCSSTIRYRPDIQWSIDRQKRLKFRRLQYRKINIRRYCDPDLTHIPGHGHRHLFKKYRRPPKPVRNTRKVTKQLNLYADAKYIYMLTHPQRKWHPPFKAPIVPGPVKVFYNCIAKRIVRKQLRNNKKIAFLSSQERFKDMDRPPPLTTSQLARIIESLPEERRLKDHPVMRKSKKSIESKLHETPKHMLPAYQLELRKRLFKFFPLPEPKVLVTSQDTTPDTIKLFFGEPIIPEDYFKTEA